MYIIIFTFTSVQDFVMSDRPSPTTAHADLSFDCGTATQQRTSIKHARLPTLVNVYACNEAPPYAGKVAIALRSRDNKRLHSFL